MKKYRNLIWIIILVITAACTNGQTGKHVPFPENIDEIQARIYEYVADPYRMPHIEIVYNIEDSVTWRLVNEKDSIYYMRETPRSGKMEVLYSLPSYISIPHDVLRIRQLIAALNPHTLPYRYGRRGDGDASLFILIENDTILEDNCVYGSVVPSEMIQIYKELYHRYSNPLVDTTDFPPYDYGSIR